MDEDELIRRYGLYPDGADLDEVRDLLRPNAERERHEQGEGDTEIMRLCCVQLFNAGSLDDVLLIWSAKTASWDADCSIDVQLLCGKGFTETKAYLQVEGSPMAQAALDRLLMSYGAGDFDGFSPSEYSVMCEACYSS